MLQPSKRCSLRARRHSGDVAPRWTTGHQDAADGALLIARCWTDESLRARVIAASTRPRGTGWTSDHAGGRRGQRPTLHSLVCTLCSCYPIGLLGDSPGWYKSRAYRSRVVREPRAVLAEFGVHIPDDVEVRVHDSTADLRYIVVPMRPAGTEHLTEKELAGLVTRDCMIGTAVPSYDAG